MATVLSPDGREPLGVVEYRQVRRGDVLTVHRVTRFADGSSDEDFAEAEVSGTLRALRGRSRIRDPRGATEVDLEIDVGAGKVRGEVRSPSGVQRYDEDVTLPPATYWGPLMQLVLKSFDENAQDGRVVFRTVVPTPAPRVIDMELVRAGRTDVTRAGIPYVVDRYRLRPTVHWAVDPLIRLIAPAVDFYVLPGEPPALVRLTGPRNYAGQRMLLE
jgi:hypothetical protein